MNFVKNNNPGTSVRLYKQHTITVGEAGSSGTIGIAIPDGQYYTMDGKSLEVYVNTQRIFVPDFAEVSSQVILIDKANVPLDTGDIITFIEYYGVINGDYFSNIRLTSVENALVVIDGKLNNGYNFKQQATIANKGFWGDVEWIANRWIRINPKEMNGSSWIGCILSDGSYMESATYIDINYTSTWNSLDGIGVLNNEWFIIYGYKKASDGLLGFDLGWMPQTTISNANPTNTLTLAQVNSKNIGLCFTQGADLVLWQDSDEWEAPYAWQNVGAVTTDKTKGKPRVLTLTGTQITLGANLQNTDFTAGTQVYQVNNFRPYSYNTGALNAAINGVWNDTGIRVRTDGGGNLLIFSIKNNCFQYTAVGGNGYSTGMNQTVTTDIAIRTTYVPADKVSWIANINYNISNTSNITTAFEYYDRSAGVNIIVAATPGGVQTNDRANLNIKHQLCSFVTSAGAISITISVLGYQI